MRYIEVKGRARVGAVEFSENEGLKAEQMGKDYWLYVITDALKASALHLVRDRPAACPVRRSSPRYVAA